MEGLKFKYRVFKKAFLFLLPSFLMGLKFFVLEAVDNFLIGLFVGLGIMQAYTIFFPNGIGVI